MLRGSHDGGTDVRAQGPSGVSIRRFAATRPAGWWASRLLDQRGAPLRGYSTSRPVGGWETGGMPAPADEPRLRRLLDAVPHVVGELELAHVLERIIEAAVELVD